MTRSIFILLITFLPACMFSQKDNSYGGFVFDYNNNLNSRQSFALGLVVDVQPLKKAPRLLFNYHHSFGISSDKYFYAHTNVLPWLFFQELVHNQNEIPTASKATKVLLLIPQGITYFIKNSDPAKIGIYCNFFNYDFWKLPNNKEIDAGSIELGLKAIVGSDKDVRYYFSAGTSYLIAGGNKNLLPQGYSNGPLLNISIGIVGISNSTTSNNLPR